MYACGLALGYMYTQDEEECAVSLYRYTCSV